MRVRLKVRKRVQVRERASGPEKMLLDFFVELPVGQGQGEGEGQSEGLG